MIFVMVKLVSFLFFFFFCTTLTLSTRQLENVQQTIFFVKCVGLYNFSQTMCFQILIQSVEKNCFIHSKTATCQEVINGGNPKVVTLQSTHTTSTNLNKRESVHFGSSALMLLSFNSFLFCHRCNMYNYCAGNPEDDEISIYMIKLSYITLVVLHRIQMRICMFCTIADDGLIYFEIQSNFCDKNTL